MDFEVLGRAASPRLLMFPRSPSDLSSMGLSEGFTVRTAKHESEPVAPVARLQLYVDVPEPDRRPRRVSAEAHGAMGLLEHAVAYLADARELPASRVMDLDPGHPDGHAVLILVEAKLEVYLSCPAIERRSRNPLAGIFKGPDRRRRP